MREDSFSKFCISACIFMILISLSINVVVAMNVFQTGSPSPFINQSTIDATQSLAGGDIFSFLGINIANIVLPTALGLLGLAAVVYYAIRSGSFTLVAVYLFGMVFWGSWGTSLSMLTSYGTYFSSAVMQAILLLLTVVMVFIFAGATIGILGGTD